MDLNKRETLGWVDMLRVAACLLVVFSHSCDAFVGQFGADRQAFLTGVFLGSLTRPCVPLFAMLTGVLLLPVKAPSPLTAFYRKRIPRIVYPLAFWSLLLPVVMFVYYTQIFPGSANPLIDMGSYNSTSLLQRLTTFWLNFNFDTVPLWYLYMLIGLYLVIPVVSAWLTQASRRDLRTVLILWGASLLLPYVKMAAPMLGYQGNYGCMELLGVCDWNAFGTLYYSSGFIGYLLLAYYLETYPLTWSWRKTLAISVPMFAAGYAVTSLGYIATNELYPGNYAYLEVLWYFCGANVFMMTFPVFLIGQKLAARPTPRLSALAGTTFGIYLCHYPFVFIGYDLYNIPALPDAVRIVLTALTAFAASYAVVRLMQRVRPLARFVR